MGEGEGVGEREGGLRQPGDSKLWCWWIAMATRTGKYEAFCIRKAKAAQRRGRRNTLWWDSTSSGKHSEFGGQRG